MNASNAFVTMSRSVHIDFSSYWLPIAYISQTRVGLMIRGIADRVLTMAAWMMQRSTNIKCRGSDKLTKSAIHIYPKKNLIRERHD